MQHTQTIDVVFLDGVTKRVTGSTFSAICAAAAYERVQEGATTHKELTPDEKKCRLVRQPPNG